MNINSLLNLSGNGLWGSGSNTSSSQATSASSPLAQALAKATQRIQSDVDSTKAQLSSFGVLKSAVSSGQLAAQALTQLSSASTESGITQAAGNFFNAFNSTIAAAKTSASAAGNTSALQNATRVNRDLRSALSSDVSTRDALKKLGFSLQSDGTLKHDVPQFAAALKADPGAVRAALGKIGQQVSAAASQELAVNGNVSDALSKLNVRSTALAAQQKALTAAAQTGATTTPTASAYQASIDKSLAAYRSNF